MIDNVSTIFNSVMNHEKLLRFMVFFDAMLG